VIGLGRFWATLGQMLNLELQRNPLLRQFVPMVNIVCRALDGFKTREELAMVWFVDGILSRPEATLK